MDYFRGVIWEKPHASGISEGKHKYVVAGILITDEELPNSSTGPRGVVDGPVVGLATALSACEKKHGVRK